MGDKIDVRVSPNETQYKRYDVLVRAVEARSDIFNAIVLDSESPFDILFSKGDKKYGVECKEIADWYASIDNEHLVDQIVKHLESPFPTNITIFGSQDEVIAEAPNMGYDGYQDWNARLAKVLKQRGFKGDCEGFCIPVRYQSKNYKRTFDEILSSAHNICDGPSICCWMSKKEEGLREAIVIAKWFDGVSEKRARALLMHFGGIVPMCTKLAGLHDNSERKQELVKVDGIGKKTAEGILFRLGKTAGWV